MATWRGTAMRTVTGVCLVFAIMTLSHSLAEAKGEFRMGVIDPQAVFERSKAGKRAQEEFKQYAKARQKILAADETELKKLEQELATSDGSLSEEEKQKKQGKFRGKVQAFQKRVQEFNQELAGKREDMMNDYMKKISVATKVVAEQRGLALVVDKGAPPSQIVIYNRKSIDLTDKVVKELNRRYK